MLSQSLGYWQYVKGKYGAFIGQIYTYKNSETV